MKNNRLERLGSLLTEVISEVINKEVRNPNVAHFVSVTHVEITTDLHHAKVYISVIGSDLEKKKTIEALQSAAGFIAVNASKKITIRYFPALTFKLDNSVDEHLRIEKILGDIKQERLSRPDAPDKEPDEQ
jgi:ribosome-binding factor A